MSFLYYLLYAIGIILAAAAAAAYFILLGILVLCVAVFRFVRSQVSVQRAAKSDQG